MKEFIYDGTFEALLTAVFYAFSSKEPCTIKRKFNYTPSLLNETVEIEFEKDKFDKVYYSIENKLSATTLENIYHLYLSEYEDCEDIILKYLKLSFKYGVKVNLAKNNDVIMLVDKYCRRVTYEAHRFTGFVRFKEIGHLSYYASIEPDHNILPIIITHFTNRFSDQNFILHDVKREKAIIYNRSESIIIDLSKADGFTIENSSNDSSFETLWKTFYTAVNIEERKNEKLRRHFMPKRYWSHITEVK
ncbi:TIGR03915 family putative DNA repair protein [Clostridium sp. C8-1-8]|uniref:TIGR03915 family putative DNA repair protein n=1 Tax=Clostridium sp. C8-1-8 TaxID=2698831 RepID=UPI00136ADB13|nr:TIGR03915 family putative DNA repair protein [Clostridium sp. C8-1-8]